MRVLKIVNLKGARDYIPILRLQHRLVSARREGTLGTDVVLILEHTPVFTLGHNGGRENLQVSEEFLRKRGIQVVRTERGGNITYHGPGQVIAYPIIDLRAARLRVTAYVEALEEVMIRTAADVGVQAGRSPLNHGIWVGNRKLGSIGIAIRHGITFHGLALNVSLSLEPFSWILPCGIPDIAMTSLKEAGARDSDMEDIRENVGVHLQDIFDIPVEIQEVGKFHGISIPVGI